MAGFTLGLLVNVGILTYTLIEAQYNDVKICEGQNEVRTLIRLQISEQARLLPTIKYYQENPDELERALKENAESVHRFDNIVCEDPPFRRVPLLPSGL